MRKVSRDAARAFEMGVKWSGGNTRVVRQGVETLLALHGNVIAKTVSPENEVYITNAGWPTVTTKDRLNALPGVSICQKHYKWFLNGNAWDGSWTKITPSYV